MLHDDERTADSLGDRAVRSHPADPDDRAALRTLALTAHECQVLAAAAYRRAELAYVESDTVEQAHQLDRALYWQIAAGDKP